MVERIESLEQKFGIEIRAVANYEYSDDEYTVMVLMDILGDELERNLMITINIYDELGELIDTDYQIIIAEHFVGIKTTKDTFFITGRVPVKVLIYVQPK